MAASSHLQDRTDQHWPLIFQSIIDNPQLRCLESNKQALTSLMCEMAMTGELLKPVSRGLMDYNGGEKIKKLSRLGGNGTRMCVHVL